VAENTSRISTDEEEDDASTHFSSEKGLLAMRFLASGSSKNLELTDGAEERESKGVNELGVTARGICKPRHGDACPPFIPYTWHSCALDH
jgi:hypothetical protein